MVSICLSLRTFTLCQRSFVKIFAKVRLHLYQIRDSLLCLCELLQQGGRVLRSWRSSHLIFIFMISSLQSLASRRGASTQQDYRYLSLLPQIYAETYLILIYSRSQMTLTYLCESIPHCIKIQFQHPGRSLKDCAL